MKLDILLKNAHYLDCIIKTFIKGGFEKKYERQ